jgi:hypothetical protein
MKLSLVLVLGLLSAVSFAGGYDCKVLNDPSLTLEIAPKEDALNEGDLYLIIEQKQGAVLADNVIREAGDYIELNVEPGYSGLSVQYLNYGAKKITEITQMYYENGDGSVGMINVKCSEIK